MLNSPGKPRSYPVVALAPVRSPLVGPIVARRTPPDNSLYDNDEKSLSSPLPLILGQHMRWVTSLPLFPRPSLEFVFFFFLVFVLLFFVLCFFFFLSLFTLLSSFLYFIFSLYVRYVYTHARRMTCTHTAYTRIQGVPGTFSALFVLFSINGREKFNIKFVDVGFLFCFLSLWRIEDRSERNWGKNTK